eukprot:12883095-Prorocentrum_lima.AAC.1
MSRPPGPGHLPRQLQPCSPLKQWVVAELIAWLTDDPSPTTTTCLLPPATTEAAHGRAKEGREGWREETRE